MAKVPLAKRLGKKLRALRKEQGYSQEGFADAAGIDRAGYGRIERGEVDLRLSTMEKLAKALSLSVDELLAS